MHADYVGEGIPMGLSKALEAPLDVPEKSLGYLTMILSHHSSPSRLESVLGKAGINGGIDATRAIEKEPAAIHHELKCYSTTQSGRKSSEEKG
jgi:hypothetical protein